MSVSRRLYGSQPMISIWRIQILFVLALMRHTKYLFSPVAIYPFSSRSEVSFSFFLLPVFVYVLHKYLFFAG